MKSITPSQIDGSARAPPSKSMTVRAIAAASLVPDSLTFISNPSKCDDAQAARSIVETLGSASWEEKGMLAISNEGVQKGSTLECGESGLCIRLFPFIAALKSGKFTFNASGSLLKRKVGMVEGPLSELGAKCTTSGGFPPLSVRGPIKGGKITVDGSESSQHITGLLMALPLCENDSVLNVLNPKSKPYISMTLELLDFYGIRIAHDETMRKFTVKGRQEYDPRASPYEVEGDWSGAAFILVAGAVAGSAEVSGLRQDSLQADKAITEAIMLAGANLTLGKSSAMAEKCALKAFEFDAAECPDLFPPLAALAANCSGTSVIHGAKRLKGKESDRASALVQEFAKLGIKITVEGDEMKITGGKIRAAEVDSHNDHRIAMAAAAAALNASGEVKIQNPECVSKSYPGFFRDLEGLMS